MTTSDPNENKNPNGNEPGSAGVPPASNFPLPANSGSAADYVDLQALSKLAEEVMNIIPPAWKDSRNSYAANLNEVFLKNMPESIKQSEWAVPNQDQLHRLPETIAKGDSPKTPLANRDLALEKTTEFMGEQLHNMPFAFMQEMRSIVPENPDDWSAPMANSMAAFPGALDKMIESAHMNDAIRALEEVGQTNTPQMPGFVMHDEVSGSAVSTAKAFGFLADLNNPFYQDMQGYVSNEGRRMASPLQLESAMPGMNMPNAMPGMNMPSAMPGMNMQSALPAMNMPNAMPGMNMPNVMPDLNMQNGMPSMSMQNAMPDLNMQNGMPSMSMQNAMPGTNSAQSAMNEMPGMNMQSVMPGVNSAQSAMNAMPGMNSMPYLMPVMNPLTSRMQAHGGSHAVPFDLESVRRDFPILKQKINGYDLVWLDNAATTQKPQAVIDRLNYFYTHENSNIHRAAHTLAARSTDAYEAARETVRRFLNAAQVQDIVFVRGATEAINLVAQSWGRQNLRQGDEILITHLEHHANIVPWQMLCSETGAVLRVAPVDDLGQVILDDYQRLLNPRTKFVSFTQVSNALGTVTPAQEMVAAAHRYGAKVLVDGAQAISHMPVDVQMLDADFYVFSGHKVFAPTGIGVLYGRSQLLETMRPYQGGGNMIKDVTFERTLYQGPPVRFEAGTGNIADAVGLGAAIEYIERIGMANIWRHENELMEYGTAALSEIPGLHLIGKSPNKAGVLSFILDGFRTDQVSNALSQYGIAVRGGHHCAQPILRRFGLQSTVRPSLALYNNHADLDALVSAIWNIKQGRAVRPV